MADTSVDWYCLQRHRSNEAEGFCILGCRTGVSDEDPGPDSRADGTVTVLCLDLGHPSPSMWYGWRGKYCWISITNKKNSIECSLGKLTAAKVEAISQRVALLFWDWNLPRLRNDKCEVLSPPWNNLIQQYGVRTAQLGSSFVEDVRLLVTRGSCVLSWQRQMTARGPC